VDAAVTVISVKRNKLVQSGVQTAGSLTFSGGASGANSPTVRIARTGTAEIGTAATEFTIEMWIRTNADNNDNAFESTNSYDPQSTNANILWDGDSFNTRGFILGLSNGRPYIGVNNAGGAYSLVATTNITDNVWHHVAWQFRVSDGLMEILIDGNEDEEFDGPAGAVDYDGNAPTTDSYHYLCKEKLNLTFGATAELSEIRISDTRRYTGTTYTVPTAPFTDDANTVGLYHCNEGSGTTMTDSSGDGNNGELLGSPVPTWSTASPF